MSDKPRENSPDRLPTTTLWRGRFATSVEAVRRSATRYKRLTLAEAPPDLNTAHTDYMLRPSLLRVLAEAIEDVAEGLYAIETQARYRHHREPDYADLNGARKHLSLAAASLKNISNRGGGQ